MSDWNNSLTLWQTDPYFDEKTRQELSQITDRAELADRFSGYLEFGTAGLRGVMQAGTNRMNRYTVRLATAALCACLREKYPKSYVRGIAIAYDSRNNSADFARETALTACAFGVPVHIFRELAPTPLLSFAVRRLGCAAGVVITASHNTREYNGYKAYDETGCQLLPNETEKIQAKMRSINLTDIHPADEHFAREAGLFTEIAEDVIADFENAAAACGHKICEAGREELRVVYTPLHGAGNKPVRTLLSLAGFKNVFVVPQQEKPDGNFPTVATPNPEKSEALTMGIRLAGHCDADIVMATDPDSDRIAIAVLHDNLYQMITGNQLGALLVNYLIARMHAENLSHEVLVKTIVTGGLGEAIARKHGIKVIETLTGFKYIGQEITRLENDPEHRFLMGYEESCGFLAGTHVRDKDAVSTALLVCEMAAYYKKLRGMTLVNVLTELYSEYGFYLNQLDTIDIPAIGDAGCVEHIMEHLRSWKYTLAHNVREVLDYRNGINGLPAADMLKFVFADNSWMVVRPSGTEPKIKVYYEAQQENRIQAEKTVQAHRDALQKCIGSLILKK